MFLCGKFKGDFFVLLKHSSDPYLQHPFWCSTLFVGIFMVSQHWFLYNLNSRKKCLWTAQIYQEGTCDDTFTKLTHIWTVKLQFNHFKLFDQKYEMACCIFMHLFCQSRWVILFLCILKNITVVFCIEKDNNISDVQIYDAALLSYFEGRVSKN